MQKKKTFSPRKNTSRQNWPADDLPVTRQSSYLVPATPAWLESVFSLVFTKLDRTQRRLSSHRATTQKINLDGDLRIQRIVWDGHIDRTKLDQATLTEMRREKNELGREVTNFKHTLQARVAITAGYEEMLDQVEELGFDGALEADLIEDAEIMYQQQRKKSRGEM